MEDAAPLDILDACIEVVPPSIKEHGRSSEEALVSCSPLNKRSPLLLRDKKGRNRGKEKRGNDVLRGVMTALSSR